MHMVQHQPKEVYLENFRVMDDCHGEHSHHHVNHIIIKQLGSVTGQEHMSSSLKRFSSAKHCVFFRGFGPRSSTKSAQDCSESSISHKDRKKMSRREHFWKMRSANFIHSFIRSFLRSFNHSIIHSFIRSFLRSFVPSFIQSFIPSFLNSFIQSVIQSFIH